MHREEGQVHTNQIQPELHLRPTLAEELPGHLGEPVEDARKDAKDRSAKKHIVDVRYDEVAICYLVVERHNSQRRSVQTTDQEQADETQREDHRRFQADLAPED